MRFLRTIYTLCLVLALVTQAAAAVCRRCEDPGDPNPPPPPRCTNGATRNCPTGNGCPGTQTCVNGAWSTCVDTGQCAVRLGCPVSRETINVPVGPYSWACTSYFLAKPGERIHVRSSENSPSNSMDLYLYRQYGDLPAAIQNGSADFPVTYYGNYEVCAYNSDGFSTHSIRITMDVAGNESPGVACDQRPDTCFGYRGPGCAVCEDPNRQDNLVWCFAQVGSQKHDTCCAHHPGGHWCGNVGYAGEHVPDEYCQGPPPLGSSLPYKWCTAEFDRGALDLLAGYEWRTLTDPTLLSYRPLANYATPVDSHWRYGLPTAESILFPDGQRLMLGNGEWCANGYHEEEEEVICGPEQ